MRISDWSSDVCSSDLPVEFIGSVLSRTCAIRPGQKRNSRVNHPPARALRSPDTGARSPAWTGCPAAIVPLAASRRVIRGRAHGRRRSEEHTSELQSLMRISYAVFCLKKKTIQCYSLYSDIL